MTTIQTIVCSVKDGANAGVSGTPAFIIGKLKSDGGVEGEFISGAQSYNTFKEAIERQLAK